MLFNHPSEIRTEKQNSIQQLYIIQKLVRNSNDRTRVFNYWTMQLPELKKSGNQIFLALGCPVLGSSTVYEISFVDSHGLQKQFKIVGAHF